MKNICKREINNKFRRRRDLVKESLWDKMKEKFEKVKNGWGQATANQTKTDEAKRLWTATQEIFKMVVSWFTISNEMDKCLHAADIYHHAVATYGIYAYRTTLKSDCNEDCVKELGANLHTQ